VTGQGAETPMCSTGLIRYTSADPNGTGSATSAFPPGPFPSAHHRGKGPLTASSGEGPWLLGSASPTSQVGWVRLLPLDLIWAEA
jgi:hypothetical protein